MKEEEEENGSKTPSSLAGIDVVKAKHYNSLSDYLKLLFWIALVVAVGMFAVNQTFAFYYKVHLLKTPCQLCGELNPGVSICIKDLNTHSSYPDGFGGWTDPFKENNTTKINISLP